MTLSYATIFSRFLGKIRDFTLLALPEAMAAGQMCEWLHSAAARPLVRSLFAAFSMDDEIQLLTLSMCHPIEDAYDLDFSAEVLALGMVIQWLSPWVYNTETIAQLFSGAGEVFYPQADHLSRLLELSDASRKELNSIIQERNSIEIIPTQEE